MILFFQHFQGFCDQPTITSSIKFYLNILKDVLVMRGTTALQYKEGKEQTLHFALNSLALIVQRLDSVIYPVDSVIIFPNVLIHWLVIYLVDNAIQRLDNQGQACNSFRQLRSLPIDMAIY